ncbi:protein lethal(2)essential for life-like [Schistocerca cancellata]|uniref:protein lethal(2)essential for life-like n=1 Tax=Schistocerca cancellata TaxID=274614 RepID=UPI002117FE39|nr:protein lethal(2)essential for life-like [Schistocerca cancellata]
MSLLPLIFGEIEYPSPRISPRYSRNLLLDALSQLEAAQKDIGAAQYYGDDGLKVNLDVQQFKPDEVTVKVVDKFVVVEAKHEERQDQHGYISRSFTRRYLIPEDADADKIASTLSSDGVLSIVAPKKRPLPMPDANERIVPIVRSSAPAVKQVSEPSKVEQEGAAATEDTSSK